MDKKEMLNSGEEISFSYDAKSDTLYITLENKPGIGEHLKENVIIRKNPKTGTVVGITIEDFEKTLGDTQQTIDIPRKTKVST